MREKKIDIIDNDLISSNNNKIVNTSNNALEYGHFFNKTSNEIVYNLTEAQLNTLTDGLELDAGLYSIVQDTGNTNFYLQSVVQNEDDSFAPIDQSNLIKLYQNYQSQNDVDNFINSENLEQQGVYHRVEMLVNFSTSGDLGNENAVGFSEVQAILRSIGYKLDTPNSSDFNEGSTNYKITIHDGSGINVTGNLFNEFNGEIIRSKQESNVSYNEGAEFAVDDLGNTETNLFSNVNLKGSGFPDVIQIVITDFKEGDVLRTNNNDVDQSFDTATGILTLTNPLGSDNSSKITSFQNALNNVLYSSSNDNPDFQLMDVERSTDPQRLIEIRVLDNQGTTDINEARTVAKIKVDITSVDDEPVLLVNNFNRVQLVQKTVTKLLMMKKLK